jgi:hypothetical protein
MVRTFEAVLARGIGRQRFLVVEGVRDPEVGKQVLTTRNLAERCYLHWFGRVLGRRDWQLGVGWARQRSRVPLPPEIPPVLPRGPGLARPLLLMGTQRLL